MLLDDILKLDEIEGIQGSYRWGSSPAEDDHRAFLFYENKSYIPYRTSYSVEYDDPLTDRTRHRYEDDAGILIVRIRDDELVVENILKAAAEKESPDSRTRYYEPIRSVVIDDLVYGITSGGGLAVWQSSSGDLLHIISE